MKVSKIAAASPDMDEAQFNELVNDIRQRGQLVPIWTLRGEVVDGRKRLKACQILGIEPKVIEMVATGDPTVLAHSLNLLRTHYTPAQRAMFAAQMANLTHGDIKTQRNRVMDHDGQNCPPPASAPMSNKEAADLVGVSVGSVKRAKRIMLRGSPELCQAIESGEIRSHAAENMLHFPRERQLQVLAERKAIPKDTLGRINVNKGTFRPSPRRPIDVRIVRTLDQLDNAIELIEQFLDENDARDHPDYSKWVRHLYDARAKLGRTIKKHGGGEYVSKAI